MTGERGDLQQTKEGLRGDRRRSQRSRTLKSAKIIFNHKSSVLNCTVRNLSACGARLLVATVVGIPDQFELRIDGDGVIRHSKTIWKRDGEIGVTFLEASPHRGH